MLSRTFAVLGLGGLLAALAVAACSEGENSDAGGGSPESDAAADVLSPEDALAAIPPEERVSCDGVLVAGRNEITIDGTERGFFLDFPSDTTKPWAVLFSFHGYTGNAADLRAQVPFDPNADPEVPAVIVTPDDTDLNPPQGLGWDISNGKPGQGNVDIKLFNTVMTCLKAQKTIDDARIYSFGFSAGSVISSLLYSRYPNRIAAIVNGSGAWFNDPAERDLVQVLAIDWSWPDLDPKDKGNVLLTHGGKDDVTVFGVLDLEAAAQAALPFLKANGRVVVDCAHDKGHVLHPDVNASVMQKYLFAHKLGQPSPFSTSFTGFPESCKLQLP